MVTATMSQHLGLAQAITEVLTKIASCAQCATFWSVLLGLLYIDGNIILDMLLAIIMAYLSNWCLLVLLHLQLYFNILYDKESKKHHSNRNSQ